MDPVDGPILASLLGISNLHKHEHGATPLTVCTIMEKTDWNSPCCHSGAVCFGVHQSQDCRPFLDGPLGGRAGPTPSHPQRPLSAGFSLQTTGPGETAKRENRAASIAPSPSLNLLSFLGSDPEETVQRQHGRPSSHVGEGIRGVAAPELQSCASVWKEQRAGPASKEGGLFT